ncbi:hypothetical protein [Novosphingobium lentum]|uniref:hypothetical protein n=1 Tax=Novosphingobium lentum TaxID=145287 RepID=UPI000A06857A|nr:hypothetical protein [Novosphingobium lentum]
MAGNRNNDRGKGGKRRFALRAPLLAGAVIALGVLAAPTVSSAFSSGFASHPVSLAARGSIGSFTPATIDPRLAEQITVRALSGRLFRFTPAGDGNRPDRSVTVAVRIDNDNAHVASVRNVLATAATAPGVAPIRIAPTAYNLGLARGYQSFAIETALPKDIQRIKMADLATFGAGKGAAVQSGGTPARFAPQIELDEKSKPGRAPRTLEGQGDYSVDVGGSYRLSRNVKLTAGLRYSADRDRIVPLTDGKKDSQAVYVGTQFRF